MFRWSSRTESLRHLYRRRLVKLRLLRRAVRRDDRRTLHIADRDVHEWDRHGLMDGHVSAHQLVLDGEVYSPGSPTSFADTLVSMKYRPAPAAASCEPENRR